MIADWQTLPLTNPIAIFLLVLLVILGAPFLNKLKIPHIVGLILAGVLLGPFGLHVLENDKSFELFGKVGILYIMFLAGLEIDLNTLKKNSTKGIIFRLTFLILWCWVRLRVSICFILIGLSILPPAALRIR